MKLIRQIVLLFIISCLIPAVAWAGGTLDDVQTRNLVICGAYDQVLGFAYKDAKGKMSGVDYDTCRAIAAAVLGDANRVKLVPVDSYERFYSLRDKKIDVLTATTTWTYDRDTRYGISFTGINYYDGQGFMTKKGRVKKSVLELDNPKVCIGAETTAVTNTPDYFKANGKTFVPVIAKTSGEQWDFMVSGRCDAITNDQSTLFALDYENDTSDKYFVLPEVISKEPLGPAVRDDDDQWFKIVRWALFAMINAEELGVNSENVDEMLKSDNPQINWLLGSIGDTGAELGLDDEWAYQIIKQVGNYGEVFERNLGKKSPLKLERGLNGLWKNGGIMYAPPIK